MNLDWRRLRAVVLESDDWGLCAWSPDEQAFRALADTPAFRTPAGVRYGGSTLESGSDVDHLVETLMEFRGGDALTPCLQANTVMAAPDYASFRPPRFDVEAIPLVPVPGSPLRWRRDGLWEAVGRARAAGAWWPELHGLHHLPETAWLRALQRGESDALRAHEHESPVCEAVEASGEYDPREPADARTARIERAVALFAEWFGRPPTSLCPPDYRWDDRLERDAERLGVTIVQGIGERFGAPLRRLRRQLLKHRWPNVSGRRFYMPVRNAFEPCAGIAPSAIGATLRAVRGCWARGQPAAISTHRVNYVHLDAARAAAGRSALRDLLATLAGDGASFLTDVEVRDLQIRGWSVRDAGGQGVVARYHGVPRAPFRFDAPVGTKGMRVRDPRGQGEADVSLDGGSIVARLPVGVTVLEWIRS